MDRHFDDLLVNREIIPLKSYQTVLSIAGFDASNGAGIGADLKTFSALGCYGLSIITALTIQNTCGVQSLFPISAACFQQQLNAVLADTPVNVMKIGMLHRAVIIDCLVDVVISRNPVTLIVDPVFSDKQGFPLLTQKGITQLKQRLLPVTTLLTPNLPEASRLLGRVIKTRAQMAQAAIDLAAMGPQAVLIKGGHLLGDCADDCLYSREREALHWFEGTKIRTTHTHGTRLHLFCGYCSLFGQRG